MASENPKAHTILAQYFQHTGPIHRGLKLFCLSEIHPLNATPNDVIHLK